MERSASLLVLLILCGTLFLPSQPALAGGWDQGIIGGRAPAMGTAFAGLADDASAIFYNSAGIALLEEKQGIHFSLHYSGVHLKYRTPPGETLEHTGGDGGRCYMMGVIPSFFIYRQFGKFSAGFGFYIPIGGAAGSWGKDTFGFDQEQMMAMSSMTPSFSYAITPKISVGAGVNFYYGGQKAKMTFYEIPIGLFAPELAASLPLELKYLPFKMNMRQELMGPALGWNAGVMYKPYEWLSLGVNVRGPAKVTLNGPTDIITYLADPLAIALRADTELKYTLPWLITWGFAIRPMPNLVLTGDMQYNGWGKTESMEFKLEGLNFFGTPMGIAMSSPTYFFNTVKFMLGGEYTFKERYAARLGYMYTPTNVAGENVSYASPDQNVHNVSGGFGYDLKENLELLAFFMISIGEWNTRPEDDSADPKGKPAGDYTLFGQNYGFGLNWYF